MDINVYGVQTSKLTPVQRSTGVNTSGREDAPSAQQRSLREGPLRATNEDRALYQEALGVDVAAEGTLPLEVTAVEVVRRRDRLSGPLTPDIIERVHNAVVSQPDSPLAETFGDFTRSALRHLSDRGFTLTADQQALAGGSGVDRFA